jgi:D-glycero-beta-D-manno-heptose-7-phosphate kinase
MNIENGMPTNASSRDVSSREAAAILETARGRTVVVLGDLMLDEWIIGSASRISPEAPVPVVRLSERKTAPGGAANVAMNLLRLGANVRVCGVVGDDEAGSDLARELREAGADVAGLVRDPARPTTLKTRIVAQRQQMVRVDRESDVPLSRDVLEQLSLQMQRMWVGAAALCISDYDKGLATCGALTAAIQSAHGDKLRVTGGPKPLNLGCFAQADFLSLNQKEASEAASIKLDIMDAVEAAGEGLRRQLQAAALVITLGARGAALFQEGQPVCHIAAHEVEVFDVAGAGDTFLAAATVALAGGASFVEASELGNLAAAASVRHVGVVAVTPEEVCRVAAEPKRK